MRFKLLFITIFFFSNAHAGWAEETLQKLTTEEKVGQLFMIGANTASSFLDTLKNYMKAHIFDQKRIEELIAKYYIGGICFFKGSIDEQVRLTNLFQKNSKIPLLIGQDSEWGLSMRLDNSIRFPKNMTLAAMTDDVLLYRLGKEIGKQCRAIGVNVNFAPVVDINSNPENPIIGIRSFGDDKKMVAQKGKTFAKGLRDGGVIDCAKHFPGHGDTSTDSHVGLPVINHSIDRLEQKEFYPFKYLIDSGVKSIMTAHISVPSLDNSGVPASVSRNIVTNVLREQLNFQGLIFTDALNMKGICNMFTPQQVALKSIYAGNDILLCPIELKKSFTHLVESVKNGILEIQELDAHVLRILQAKEKLNLHKNCITNVDTVYEIVDSESAKSLKKTLYQKAITVIRDDKNILPIQKDDNIAIVDIGSNNKDAMFNLSLSSTSRECDDLLETLKNYNTVVLRVFKLSKTQKVFGKISEVESHIKSFLDTLTSFKQNIVIVLCASPYALKLLPNLPTLVAYEDDCDAVQSAMDVLFGNALATGVLPIHI